MYYESFALLEEEAMVGLLSGLFSMIPSSVMSIAVYVFFSLSLYTIAKRRGLNNPWLSWIPVGNMWILGSISDQYRYVVKGEVKSKRKVLMVLNLINLVLCAAFFIAFSVMIGGIVGAIISGRDESRAMREMMGSVAGMLCLVVPMAGVSIATLILRYMALYDLYTSCEPQNNTIYLVVGILVNITEPVFLFLCRNKDLGMPPRKDIPQYAYTGSYGQAPGYSAPNPNSYYYPPQEPYQAPQGNQEQ